MPTTVLYRTCSGEVLRISTTGHPFADVHPRFFGVLTNPHLPDGTTWRLPGDSEQPVDTPYHLGITKIALPRANTVRNATQAEIDGFRTKVHDELDAVDKQHAQRLLMTHPQWSKVLGCVVEALMDEINTLRAALDLPPKSARSLLHTTTSRIERCTHGHPDHARMD